MSKKRKQGAEPMTDDPRLTRMDEAFEVGDYREVDRLSSELADDMSAEATARTAATAYRRDLSVDPMIIKAGIAVAIAYGMAWVFALGQG